MDAYSTDRHDLAYSDCPPVFVTGSSAQALARAERTVEAFGLRVAGRCPIEIARDRIERQVAASALWIELDGDQADALDALLDAVSADAANGRYGAVVSAPMALVDAVTARVRDAAVEIIVDADDGERTAALAIALAGRAQTPRLSDIAADKNAARLRQLSDEVSRIASTLARLSAGPTAAPAEAPPAMAAEAPPVSADTVRAVIRARRLRARFFADDLFADPAWDMLLDLLQAEIAQLRVPVSSLCIAAAVPATTALRWLKTMVQEGLFVRRADPHDGRRVFVELAPATSNALRRYFAEVGKPAVI
jgi:DNA-binding MarR family transcriptional regulator